MEEAEEGDQPVAPMELGDLWTFKDADVFGIRPIFLSAGFVADLFVKGLGLRVGLAF